MEERKKPSQKPRPSYVEQSGPKPVTKNPSVPGVQPKNTPDGRDAPQQGETRDS